MTIRYKVKKQDSDLYWTGFSSEFSQQGVPYHSLEDAGMAITAQINNARMGITEWAKTAEVIEVKIEETHMKVYPLLNIISLGALYSELKKTHGREFLNGFKKMVSDSQTINTFKYAVEIIKDEYDQFRKTLKDLGFSSRLYKKLGNWIWFDDIDLGIRIKLLDSFTKFVDCQPYLEQYHACHVHTVPNKP